MNQDPNIPAEDRILSQKLQLFIHSGDEQFESNDPLFNILIDYKNDNTPVRQNLEMQKLRVWNNIENIIHQSTLKSSKGSPNQNIRQLFQYKYLGKIAAAVLFAAVMTLFLIQYQDSAETEIARAHSTIETVQLADGSEATLRPYSVLYATRNEENYQSYRLEGEAMFSVISNPKRQFIIETDKGKIEVLGTRFNVRTWQNETSVYLETGSLKLQTINLQKEIVLQPGEAATIKSESEITNPEIVNKDIYTAWQVNEIVFNNRTASSIFKEIEHHYSISIRAPEEINSSTLGGTLSLAELENTLNNLGVALDGNFILIEDNIYQFIDSDQM